MKRKGKIIAAIVIAVIAIILIAACTYMKNYVQRMEMGPGDFPEPNPVIQICLNEI